MLKWLFKQNAFKFLLISALLTISFIPQSPRWVADYLDPAFGAVEYTLDLNEILLLVSCRKVNGNQRLALSFIFNSDKFSYYHWCYFVNLKKIRSTPGADNLFERLMYKGAFHNVEGLPDRIQAMIAKSLRRQLKSKKARFI